MSRRNDRASKARFPIAAVVCAALGLLFAAPAMATDGAGTISVSPTYAVASSTGNEIDFTYTAPAGGLSDGELTLLVPTGWTAPSSNGFEAGGMSISCAFEPVTVTAVAGGHLVHIPEVSLSGNETCTIKYGIKGFNAGVTAPSTPGDYTFTTEEKSTSSGTLQALSAGSPKVLAGTDGTGTMTVSPTHALAGSTANTLTFTYTAAASISGGELTVAVPSGWSAPSSSASAAGATTSTCGAVVVTGSTIEVGGVSLSSGAECTITYGDKTSGPGANAPATGGPNPYIFTAQEESSNDSHLVSLASPPKVSVTAADGAGTMTASPTNVIQNTTGNEIDFTYTAPAGGLSDGELTLLVPTGWTTPSSNGFEAGGMSISCAFEPATVTAVAGGHLVHIPEVSLSGNETCTIKYGIKGFNAGVTAPSTQGDYTFTTEEKSTAAGTLTSIGTSPVVHVGGDGTGTMTVSPTHALAGSTANTLTFTYTAAVSVSGGEITMAVPSGWSAPSSSASAAGATTSTCGTVGVSGSTIEVSGVSLASGGECTITYGDKTSGPGASAPSTGGPTPSTFSTEEKSSSAGTLTTLASGSPKVSVTAGDGAGTMTASPTNVITSSTGNEIDFTYTAPAGGLNDGELTLLVPTGWTTPSSNGFEAGGMSISCAFEPVTVTSVAGGHLVHIPEVSLSGNETCTIKYGIKGFNAGVTAPSTPGDYTFTTEEKSTSSGTLAGVALSPEVTVGSDGTGTMTVSPTHVLANMLGFGRGSSHITLTFTYTAAAAVSGGELTVAIPSGWSAPSSSASAAGATSTTCGSVAVTGSTIEVSGVSLASGAECTITYGDQTSGPGASAPSAGGLSTFATKEKSSSAGTLTALGTGSPRVSVTAADGTGTMTVSPTNVLNESTGNELTFTYTAPSGGLEDGELTLTVPTGWTTPQTGTPSAAGWVISSCGASVSVTGMTIEVTEVGLTEGSTCTITYGDKFEGPGATAPTASGADTFSTQERSATSGTLTDIATMPVVNVNGDGTGTLTVSPLTASAGSSANTLTFTYTSAVALNSGEVTIALPAGWSEPSTTSTDAGYTTTSCPGATVGSSGNTIQVSAITIAKGASCTITYGDTGSGGPGASATATVGESLFSTQEKSEPAGTLTPIKSSPHLTVYAPDGSGTMTVAPTAVGFASAANTLTFTYTAASGGLSSGELQIAVPAGWSEPSTTPKVAGYTTSTCGSVSVSARTIEVSGVTRAAAGTCTITYGDKSSGGVGAIAPSASGPMTFATKESSTALSTPTALAVSPGVMVFAADGSGAMVVQPVVVEGGSVGNVLSFTYTAAVGGMSDGEVVFEVPAGWSAPSTTASAAGYSTSGCGTLAVSSRMVEVSGVTLVEGATCTIVYGSKASGGPGASSPAAPAVDTFSTQQRSTATGTLTNIATMPVVNVNDDGRGTMTVSPVSASAGSSGHTLTFEYTAASGGLSSGELQIALPAGWSEPSTTATAAGYTTTSCPGATVGSSGNTIQVSAITLTEGTTCTITYGDKGSGGPGASATASVGESLFSTQEKSEPAGTLTALAVSPGVMVFAADGSGVMVVQPVVVEGGSVGNVLSFTYTAAVGGMSDGEVVFEVPAGWSVPSMTNTAAGYSTSGCGTLAVSSRMVEVSGVTLAEGATCTIVYGSKASGGPGASSPSGDSVFAASESSTSAGVLGALTSSPSVGVNDFYTLTVTVSGSGTVTGSGISCPGTCSMRYREGTTVTLSATPATGSTFSGWGAACSGSGACSVTMSADEDVSATFAVQKTGGETAAETKPATGTGTTTPPPPPSPCDTNAQQSAASAAQAALKAVTGEGLKGLASSGKVKFSFVPETCGGYRFLLLARNPKPGKHKREVTVGYTTFVNHLSTILAGQTKTVDVAINKTGRSILEYAKAHKIKLHMVLATHVRASNSTTSVQVSDAVPLK